MAVSDTISANPMIASDRVEGTSVYDPGGERLGSIARFMVDKVSGQVEYAELAFGGILGIGNRYYPLPWQALSYDTDKGGYIVNVTREQIEGAPNFEGEQRPDYDRTYAEQLYGYWGVPF